MVEGGAGALACCLASASFLLVLARLLLFFFCGGGGAEGIIAGINVAADKDVESPSRLRFFSLRFAMAAAVSGFLATLLSTPVVMTSLSRFDALTDAVDAVHTLCRSSYSASPSCG